MYSKVMRFLAMVYSNLIILLPILCFFSCCYVLIYFRCAHANADVCGVCKVIGVRACVHNNRGAANIRVCLCARACVCVREYVCNASSWPRRAAKFVHRSRLAAGAGAASWRVCTFTTLTQRETSLDTLIKT